MIKHDVTDWDPERELTALLDGLTEELLAAPLNESPPFLQRVSDERHEGIREIRRLIAAADADLVAPSLSTAIGTALRALALRNH